MRDILDKMLLIEAIETREPDFRFLMLEDNHIFIIEDDPRDQAVDAVIAAIRKLGTETDEGRAISQRIFGKEPEDVTDQEVFKKIIAPGFDGVGPFAPEANRQIRTTSPDKLDSLGSLPGAKATMAAALPKGRVNTPVGPVDLDVSAGDLGVVQNIYQKLGKEFPKAKEKLNTGDVMGALRQVYNRMQN